MSNIEYLKLRNGVTHWLEDSVGENLKYSVIDFYKWAFLEAGAYQTITRSPATSGVYGGDRFRLGYADDPRFTAGTVWQGFRNEWVWETGVSFNPQPTSVNVYVNTVQQPATGYYVDYPRGRVVFSTPIATGAIVQADYSHRTVNFVSASEPWFREVMFDSYQVQRADFLTSTAGGKWRQLPMVGVEVVGTAKYKPYQIGGGQWIYQDVVFYVYAERESDRNKLRDIISDQNDRIIWLYDRTLMKENNLWPFFLDSRGVPVSGFWTYPSVVAENNGFRFLNGRFMETRSQNIDINNDWLWGAVVRTTVEMINPYG
jgi:hypothetical protein